MIYCRKCGNQIPDDSTYCSQCGCKQNDSIGNANALSEQSQNTSNNNESSLHFGYNEKQFGTIIIVIVLLVVMYILLSFVLPVSIKVLPVSIKKVGGLKKLIILCIGLNIWSCITLQKQHLCINKDTISGIANGFIVNTTLHSLSIKQITNVQVIQNKMLMITANNKAYGFYIENAEKAHLELHKRMNGQ